MPRHIHPLRFIIVSVLFSAYWYVFASLCSHYIVYDSSLHLPELLSYILCSLNVGQMNLGMNECKSKCVCECPIPTLDSILPFSSLQLTTEEGRTFYLQPLPNLSEATCTPLRNHPGTFKTRLLSFSLVENKYAHSLSLK